MHNPPTQNTLTSDWNDLDDEDAPSGLGEGSNLGPFLLERLLGRGGMGLVYAATHRGTGAEVALKTLHRVDTRAATKLKSEFRQLARVRHPHLVQLYELHTVDSFCFLTMERIDGLSLTAKLENGKRGSENFFEELRVLFRQLTEGLLALHNEGLLHLDLKPDNVMVDRNGSIRILDFGLVASLHGRQEGNRRGIAGTPRYMAPERKGGERDSTTADWYSLGMMLAEQLAEERPSPDEPLVFHQDAPNDLVDLCSRLLEPNPSVRMSGEEVATVLGAKTSGTYRTSTATRLERASIVVGRDTELAHLSEALTSAQSGRPRWVGLSGESGIGKSVLMRSFCDSLEGRTDITVLEGTCHERESMPFQGLDGILDGLAIALFGRAATNSRAAQVLLKRAVVLSDSFRELCQGPPLTTSPQDPIERRRDAFSAIKGLIASLTRTQTVVLLIDDIQWGDSDGARLLAEVLVAPTPGRLLLITTSCHEDNSGPAFLEELDSLLRIRGSTIVKSVVELGHLSAQHLEACVPPLESNANKKRREAIVRASGGLPFLAAALGSHPWAEDETPSLLSLINMRLDEAPLGALEVIRAISLSPSPLPQAVALELVKDASRRGAVLTALRNANLVRTSGITPDAPLEPYHALVAKTVLTQISTSAQRRLRIQIATSLEEKKLATAEQLAHLFHLADDNVNAARWAPAAALEAERALAFESAAHWYGRAALWLPQDANDYRPKQARCLEYAGRAAEAAAAYEKCAQLLPEQRSAFVRAAGSAWLNAGHVDRGLAALAPELEELGTPIPGSERIALARSIHLLLKLWRRGTAFEVVPESSCPAIQLSRVDALWHAAKVLGAPLPLRGLALQLQCLIFSLQTGESGRVARSLAVLGPMFVGTPWEKMGAQWSARASQLVAGMESNYLRGIVLTFEAVRMTANWDAPERILERATEAFEVLKRERGPIAWEQSVAFTTGLRALEQLGRFEELQQLGTLWLGESTDRGDLFAQAMACQARVMSYLASNEIAKAREFTQRSIAQWSPGSFTVQHYYALRFDLQSDLVEGKVGAALEKIRRSWRELQRAQLLRHPISRPEILFLRGIIELAASSATGARRCRIAEKLARWLMKDKNPVSRAHGKLLEAACMWSQTPNQPPLELMGNVQREYLGQGQVLLAACTLLLLNQAAGNRAGCETAETQLLALGVSNPKAYARIHVPLVHRRGSPDLNRKV